MTDTDPAGEMAPWLPCPHCGAKPHGLVRTDLPDESWSVAVLCANCGALGGDGDTEAQAVALWNRRPPAPAVELVEEDEPPRGLLISMAIREDHGFLMLPQVVFGRPMGLTAQQRESRLNSMRQLWEEATGRGFWSPERNASYEADYARAALPEQKDRT